MPNSLLLSRRFLRLMRSVCLSAVPTVLVVSALPAQDMRLAPEAFAVATGAGVFFGGTQGTSPVRSDSLDAANTVRAYHRALSSGDSLSALALLAADAVILESGGIESREEYRSHHLPADIQAARALPTRRAL